MFIGEDMGGFLQTNIFLSFNSEQRKIGIKKTITDILRERFQERGDYDLLFSQARLEANRMVALRILYHELDRSVSVFSKDSGEKYFWRPSNFVDRTVNSVLLSLSESKKDYVLSLLCN